MENLKSIKSPEFNSEAWSQAPGLTRALSRVVAKPLVAMIWVYQRTLSPDHGWLKSSFPHGYCRFYPSCSEYARLSLRDAGISSFPKIVWRIIRCNPFNPGGIDLPEKTK